jgi:hypothetical protein
MLGQFLPGTEAEQHHPHVFRAQQGATHDAVGGELGFGGKLNDLFQPRDHQGLFGHGWKLTRKSRHRLDTGQSRDTYTSRMNRSTSLRPGAKLEL